MEHIKKVALAGNLLVFLLMVFPAILSIVTASGFLESECSGALMRPAIWLMTDGIINIILLFLATVALILYLFVGHRFLFYTHMGFCTVGIVWYLLWSVVAIVMVVFKDSSCTDHTGNFTLFAWIGVSIIWKVFVYLATGVFVAIAGLTTTYHEMATGYDYFSDRV